MLMKKINHTDLYLSSICLGTDDFGTTVEKKRAFDVLDYYHENGGNVLDTARVYASWIPGGAGMSEKTIGEWMKARGARNDIVISTKCAHPNLDSMQISRLSAEELESDVDQSLLALGVDCIDIMWLHRDDEKRPVSGIMDSLNRIVKKGKVRYFGVSNWHGIRIEEANAFANAENFIQLIASQIKWSYAMTNPQYEEDPTLVEMDDIEKAFYQKSGIPVFAYASQAKGFFAKFETGGVAALSHKAAERYCFDENIRRYEKAKKLADELNVPISSVVLGYITSRQDIKGFTIAGCKNIDQITDSISHSDIILTSEMIDYLEA